MPDLENCHLHTGVLVVEANNAIAKKRNIEKGGDHNASLLARMQHFFSEMPVHLEANNAIARVRIAQ